MNKYVIGIDPGSTKGHGVAVYVNGKLEGLHMMTLFQLYHFLKSINGSIVVAIEDNEKEKRTFNDRLKNARTKMGAASMGQDVGRVKWAQLEVERMLNSEFGIKPIKMKQGKHWKCSKTGKPQFEKVTGWNGSSNEDTRSAAYFGYLEATK